MDDLLEASVLLVKQLAVKALVLKAVQRLKAAVDHALDDGDVDALEDAIEDALQDVRPFADEKTA